RRITPDRITQDQLVAEMNDALQIPGLSNAWTMPVKARTAMLTTGIRTPIGLKIFGSDVKTIDEIGSRVAAILAPVPGARRVFAGYVYVDLAGRAAKSYIEEAGRRLAEQLTLPPGYTISWSGQYEDMERVRQRLMLVVPATMLLVVLLLYLNTRSMARTLIVILAVPFSAIGAVWLLYLLGYNLSIGVWVGVIALVG